MRTIKTYFKRAPFYNAFTRQVDAATLARLIYTPTIAVLDCCS